MSRILLLILFMIWTAAVAGGGPSRTSEPSGDLWPNLLLFFSVYLALVIVLGLWSRALARRVAASSFRRSLGRFNNVMFVARLLVPVWFFVGVQYLGWWRLLTWQVRNVTVMQSVLGLVLGTLPALATWMGLWWSQYPAERALREQNLMIDLDNDIPLHQPPAFKDYFLSNFRLQVLFTLAPVALLKITHDALLWLLNEMLPPTASSRSFVETGALIIAGAVVFLLSPAILRRVLVTTPMPDSPLFRRLDALCRRAGVRYRRILIWDTHHYVGNAAVMGVLPWLRYVLLSDVLLERMSDEEIEAVFAHELGHIVHRHMAWYGILFIVLILVMYAGGNYVDQYFPALADSSAAAAEFGTFGFVAMFFLLFGALSRRCERQADVYAARTLEMLKIEEPLSSEGLFDARQLATVGAGPLVPPRAADQTAVGQHGAWMFGSALRRVAIINNIPIAPRPRPGPGLLNRMTGAADAIVETCNNWLHGSIAGRVQYVQDLSADPGLTGHFDRSMLWIFGALLFALFTSVVFSVLAAQ